MSNSAAWSPKAAASGLCQEDSIEFKRGGQLLGQPQADGGQLSMSQGPGFCSWGLLQATSIQKDLPQRELFFAETQVAFTRVVCH